MSVLIRGMEMPTARDTLVLVKTNGTAIVYEDEAYVKTAVPVPPHGRLGDLDALANVFRGFIAMYDSCPFSQLSLPDKARRDELQSALAEVINAPTIIQADENSPVYESIKRGLEQAINGETREEETE